MKKSVFAVAAFILPALSGCETIGDVADQACVASEEKLLGYWGGGGYFEEMQFAKEADGSRSFNSWLHARPAESGSWMLNDCELTITVQNDRSFEYRVVSVTKSKLNLFDMRQKSAESYKRIEQ